MEDIPAAIFLAGKCPNFGRDSMLRCRRIDEYFSSSIESCRTATEFCRKEGHFSGTGKEPKPKLLSPDIFRWGRGLPREGVGAKKFDMSLETREIKLFWRDIPGFCWDIPAAPEKFEKKRARVQFLAPNFDGEFKSHLMVKSKATSWLSQRPPNLFMAAPQEPLS